MALRDEIFLILISASPLVELRGAIPWGINREMDVSFVLATAVLGNLLPVIPLLFLFNFLIKVSRKIKFFDKIFSWWFLRVEKKHYLVEKYGLLGLVFLVAVPLPGSGAWTGCLASALFEIRFTRAFLAICLGVLIAGVAVTLISTGVVKLWSIFI